MDDKVEQALAKWREEYDARSKCNEQWRNYKCKFEEFVDAIKSEVSEDVIHCMKHVNSLPHDCGTILVIDSYTKYLPARMMLAEILEEFATGQEYMTGVKMFVVLMVRNQWWLKNN